MGKNTPLSNNELVAKLDEKIGNELYSAHRYADWVAHNQAEAVEHVLYEIDLMQEWSDTELALGHIQLETLPPELWTLSDLVTLKIDTTYLNDLSGDIANLISLEKLEINSKSYHPKLDNL